MRFSTICQFLAVFAVSAAGAAAFVINSLLLTYPKSAAFTMEYVIQPARFCVRHAYLAYTAFDSANQAHVAALAAVGVVVASMLLTPKPTNWKQKADAVRAKLQARTVQ